MSGSESSSESGTESQIPNGFYLPVIQRDPSLTFGSTDAQMEREIATLTRLRPWSGFREEVRRVWGDARSYLGDCSTSMVDPTCNKRARNIMSFVKNGMADVEMFQAEFGMYEFIAGICRACVQLLNDIGYEWETTVVASSRTRTYEGLQTEVEGLIVQLSGDVSVFNKRKRRRTMRTPEACFEAKLPFKTLDIPDNFQRENSRRRASLVRRFQKCLSHPQSTRYGHWIRRALCQTILEAMHTRTGCSSLTTLNEIVFLRVEGVDNGKVDVVITDVFKNAGQYAVCHGILAFLKIVRSMFQSSDERQTMLARLASQLPAMFLRHQQTERERALRDTPAGGATRRSRTSRNSSNGARDRAVTDDVGDVLGVVQNKDPSMGRSRGSCNSGRGEKVVSRTEVYEGFEWLTEEESDLISCAMKSSNPVVLSRDLMERAFMLGRQTYIGSGASGIVVRTVVQGIPVAVKKWNWDSSMGLEWLQNEVKMYAIIWKLHPELLGSAVPRLFAMTTMPAKDITLVTEFVGSEVRCTEGGFYFEGRKLSVREVNEISDAAARSLTMLARCRIVHNDVDARNLRVEEGLPKGAPWKALWIDLGCAHYIETNEKTSLVDEAAEFASQWRLSL